MPTIGDVLLEDRLRCNMTQVEAVVSAGFKQGSSHNLSKFERGVRQPSLKFLVRIAPVYGYSSVSEMFAKVTDWSGRKNTDSFEITGDDILKVLHDNPEILDTIAHHLENRR